MCVLILLILAALLVIWCICKKRGASEEKEEGDKVQGQEEERTAVRESPYAAVPKNPRPSPSPSRKLQKEFCGTVHTHDPTNVDDDDVLYENHTPAPTKSE